MRKRQSAARLFGHYSPQSDKQQVEESYSEEEVLESTEDDLSLDLDAGEDFESYSLVEEQERKMTQKNQKPAKIAAQSPPIKSTPSEELQPISSEELQLEKEPIKVRETGQFWWKRVIIPPNVYVVHTRLGRAEPVTIGLGKSFYYNSNKDAYLVVPAAMQTIGVVARCITREKQGINILAYVQWQISDFSIAYQKLDVSDSHDPLGIVNAQLNEQAEAAIKDKIATMSVEEVLTDKAPIIEELTMRLKRVTEGRSQEEGDERHEGLGIKIVTVQIREAIVSSPKLWQDLQAPFRHQQEKIARISQMVILDDIHKKELENRQLKETREAETLAAIEQVKQSKETERVQFKLTEQTIRLTKEQESIRQKVELEEQTTIAQQESEQQLKNQKIRLAHENQLTVLQQEHAREHVRQSEQTKLTKSRQTLQTEEALHTVMEENRLNEAKVKAKQQQLEQEQRVKKQIAELKLWLQEQEDLIETKKLQAQLNRQRETQSLELELEEARHRIQINLREKEIEVQRQLQTVYNSINESDLLRRFIEKSSEIAAEMPDIHELRVLQTGNDDVFDTFSTFITKMLALADSLGLSLKTKISEENKD